MTEAKPRATGFNRIGRNVWTRGLPGLMSCLWYALPDYVPSRKRRTAAKAVLLAAVAFYGARLGREVAAEEVGLGATEQGRSDEGRSTVNPARQGLVLVLALVPLTIGAVVAERFIYRTTEGLANRGVSHPHTKVGLVMGFLTPLAQRGIELLQETGTSQLEA
ncbi:MAG: hypothetical protein WBG89_03235 [Ornithinimicrobium sp.]